MLKIDRASRGILGEDIMNNKKYTEEMLLSLRERVRTEMSEKRYRHTLEVEKMAERIGKIYLPEKIIIVYLCVFNKILEHSSVLLFTVYSFSSQVMFQTTIRDRAWERPPQATTYRPL